MKTYSMTAIYFQYVQDDINDWCNQMLRSGQMVELLNVTIVRNAPDKDGFITWTATVEYK